VGRPRLYEKNADRQRAYRERQARDSLHQIPALQGENYVLYQADAWQLLPVLTAVDVVITDPPYSAKTHAGARGGGFRQTTLIDFACMTPRDAIRLVRQCCALARRWVVLWMDWRHASAVEAVCPELFVRAGVWVKRNGAPQFTGDRPGTGWESIVICHRPGKKAWNGGGHHAVWDIPRINGAHPTEKPPPLLADLVTQFSNPGEVILDPFMGSGSTGEAALRQGRRFLGVEINAEYCAMASTRLDSIARQGQLFAGRGAAAHQGALW
jgi:site-specific DNA-methyltransferase (adenine-specific)